jgi:hypothetical protein
MSINEVHFPSVTMRLQRGRCAEHRFPGMLESGDFA